jgi:hypothetical protein
MGVYVAADGGDRRDLAQAVEDGYIAYIAGVQDVVDPSQGS